MSIITDLIGTILKPVAGVIDELHLSGEEKLEAKTKLFEAQAALAIELERGISKEVEAKQAVMVAELQQGDNYVKRARPTVVYAGLFVVAVNHMVLPWVAFFLGHQIPQIELPGEFWLGWSGIVATWIIGRTAERRGAQNKILSAITGT